MVNDGTDVELRKWSVDAAIRVAEAVIRAVPQNAGATNNINIDIAGEARQIYAFIRGDGP